MQEYIVFASICFIYLNIVWVGVLRPLIMALLNMCVRVPTHSNRYGSLPLPTRDPAPRTH